MEAALISPSGRTTLGATVVSIGRRADNTLVIEDAKASSHHAEIRPMGEGYSIVDLGSTNGTFINEQRIGPNTPQMLNPNDIIRIGDTRFTFEVKAPTATVFDAPQNNPAYLPTVAAGPSYVPPVQNNQSPAPYPNYNPPPAYPTPNQNAPYGATEAAPSPYTAYQGGQVPPPPAYNVQSPYQQQQQYYPPYGQGQPPVPSPKPPATSLTARFRSDSRFRLIVIGAGVLLLLLIIAGGIAIAGGGSSPTKTLTQYCNDFKAGDFNSAYDLLSSNTQSTVSRSQYISTEQGVNQAGGVTNCSVTNVNESDPSATGNIVYTFGNGRTLTGRYTLVLQNGTWKISNETVS